MGKLHGCSSLPGSEAFEIHWDGFHRIIPPVGQCYIRTPCSSLTCGFFRFHQVVCSSRSLLTGRLSCFATGPTSTKIRSSSRLPASLSGFLDFGFLTSLAALPSTLGFVSEGIGLSLCQVSIDTSWPFLAPPLLLTAKVGSANVDFFTASPTAGPKMCIGGSGAHSDCSAGGPGSISAITPRFAFGNDLTTLFVMWSFPVLVFFQTLMVISTASLCKLLLLHLPGSRSPLGRLCLLPLAAAPTSVALPWGTVSPDGTPPYRPCRPIPRGRRPSTIHCSRPRFSWFSRPLWGSWGLALSHR